MNYRITLAILAALTMSIISSATAQNICETTEAGAWTAITWQEFADESCTVNYPGEAIGDRAVILHAIELDTDDLEALEDMTISAEGGLDGNGRFLEADQVSILTGSSLGNISIESVVVSFVLIGESNTVFITGDVTITPSPGEDELITVLSSEEVKEVNCDNPLIFSGSGTVTLNGAIWPDNPLIVADGVTLAGTGAADAVCTDPADDPASVGGFAEPLAPEGE